LRNFGATSIMSTSDFSFPRNEHLKHRRLFETLFAKGKKEFKYPVMAVWVETDLLDETPIKAGFTASKKNYKRAVMRNSLKRKMREAYRLQKAPLLQLLQAQNKQIAVLFVTVKTDNTSYEVLQDKILLLLQEIEGKLRNAG
jgi:ribonuclease P protein component